MLRPSGETSGSPTHCKSNTSSGFKGGLTVCAGPGADSASNSRAAAAARGAACRNGFRSFILFPRGCHPAVALMLVDDSHGLHECVANGRPDETKAPLLQVLAHGIAVRARYGDVPQSQRPVAQRPAAGELPDVVVEGAQGGADLQVGPGVPDECIHFEAISDDTGIEQQAPALGGVVAGHFLGVETVEGFEVSLALAQYREPAQPRLSALQTEHLEELDVIVQRPAPL